MTRGPVSLLTLALAGCLSPDPEHCANREGNATCEMLGAAPHCSICASDNAGCVEETPSAACYRPGSGTNEESSSGSTSVAPMSSSESTAAAECVTEGMVESCDEAAPYCVDGECTSCESHCSALDPAALCHPDSNACVECVGNDDCPDRVCSDAYACTACTRHIDCFMSNACNLRTGECFDPDHVLWVDGAACDASGTGTEDDPFCTLQTAVATIGSAEMGVINYHASPETFSESLDFDGVSARTLVLRGIDGPVMQNVDTTLDVGGGSTLFVEGVRILNSTTAVVCDGDSQVWLTDVVIRGVTNGIQASNCDRVVVERSTMVGVTNVGVDQQAGRLDVVSSAFVDIGSPGTASAAIDASNTELSIRYSTFAGNQGVDGASVRCVSSQGEIRNSALVSPDAPSVVCPGVVVRTSAVDQGVEGEGVANVGEYDPAWFVDLSTGSVRLANPDESPFRGVAVWDLGDPLRDLSGTRRLAYPGLAEFAGAEQP